MGRRHSPRTTSSSSDRRRCAASGSRPAFAPTGWRVRAEWAAWSRSGSSTAGLGSMHGRWIRGGSGATTPVASTRWPAPARFIRPTTTSSTPATNEALGGHFASRRFTLGSPSSVRRSARSPVGSAPTGSSLTRPAEMSLCDPVDGPGACGRRRSARSTRRAASRLRSSTSRHSPRSRCAGEVPHRSWRASPTIASPAP